MVIVFLAFDLTWPGVVMAKFYKTELGPLARRSGEAMAPVWGVAFLVYVSFGIVPLCPVTKSFDVGEGGGTAFPRPSPRKPLFTLYG